MLNKYWKTNDKKKKKNNNDSSDTQIAFTYSHPICKPARPKMKVSTPTIIHQDLYVQHER